MRPPAKSRRRCSWSRALTARRTTAVLNSLPWRERRVIELRFGLGDKGPMTLEDVGHEVGVTRERVRQIELKTLAMLKSSGGVARLAGTTDEAQ
jgi:RNA polymerase primary sigma factor